MDRDLLYESYEWCDHYINCLKNLLQLFTTFDILIKELDRAVIYYGINSIKEMQECLINQVLSFLK